jgi:hypothetical protein
MNISGSTPYVPFYSGVSAGMPGSCDAANAVKCRNTECAKNDDMALLLLPPFPTLAHLLTRSLIYVEM